MDDIGIDSIEGVVILSVAMEAGIIPFGDEQGLPAPAGGGDRQRNPPGPHPGWRRRLRALGNAYGLTRTGGQEPGHSRLRPRTVKGIGITYATTTMGADHTSGYTIATNILNVGGYVDPLKKDGQVELSRNLQIATAAVDSTGMCIFIAFRGPGHPGCLPALIDMINARFGLSLSGDDVVELGKYVLKTEHEFNRCCR